MERLLQKCRASAVTLGKQKEIESCQKYIQNNWLGIIVRYDDAGADWGVQCRGADQPCVVSKGIQPSYGMVKAWCP